MCIHDSRNTSCSCVGVGTGAVALGEHLQQLAGEVAAHQQLRVHDHVHARGPASLSSMVTESTRNGMSSVTTSTTVCPLADQPCSETVGVKTRTLAVPCGR